MLDGIGTTEENLQAAIDEGVEIPDPAIFYVMPVSRAYYPQQSLNADPGNLRER